MLVPRCSLSHPDLRPIGRLAIAAAALVLVVGAIAVGSRVAGREELHSGLMNTLDSGDEVPASSAHSSRNAGGESSRRALSSAEGPNRLRSSSDSSDDAASAAASAASARASAGRGDIPAQATRSRLPRQRAGGQAGGQAAGKGATAEGEAAAAAASGASSQEGGPEVVRDLESALLGETTLVMPRRRPPEDELSPAPGDGLSPAPSTLSPLSPGR